MVDRYTYTSLVARLFMNDLVENKSLIISKTIFN